MMSSSPENQFAQIETDIESIPETRRVRAGPLLQFIIRILKSPSATSRLGLFSRYLEELKKDDNVTKITASDISVEKITEIFRLETNLFSQNALWQLNPENNVKAPKILYEHLRDLRDGYEERSEATWRTAIDIILIQCCKFLKSQYAKASAQSYAEAPATPSNVPGHSPLQTKMPLKVCAESSISAEITHPLNSDTRIVVTGRADWALGYKGDDAALLVAIEAKKRSGIGRGEAQLLAYLAIIRENRRKAGKINTTTQGFYSDGEFFCFVAVRNDSTVRRSPMIDINLPHGLDIVFSFLVTMLDTALKSTPTASPTTPGAQQEKEIRNYEEEVWAQSYELVQRSLAPPDSGDEDMDDVVTID
ncbi:MAG: hypothetical protein LQ338_003399 [Usnochroma carphineum]|nr:MAG: hypothetical protein LQ338_003399 [Usnochroma carphineum]